MKHLFLFGSILLLAQCGADVDVQPDITSIANPSPPGARFPNLHGDSNGATMSWIQSDDEVTYHIAYSKYEDGAWSEPETLHSSSSYFVNWADFPSVVTWDGNPIAAHWLQKVDGGTYAYHVNMTMMQADGSWGDVFSPHTDGTPTEHGFVSLLPLDSERVLAVWLDGRNTEGGSHEGHDDHHMGTADLSTAMTLRSAVVSIDGTLSHEQEIDSAVCDCCQTGLTAVPGGALAIYRNRDENEIRDIAIARFDLETGTWSTPTIPNADGWEIGGCPVNGPRIIANGHHVVAVWFTMAGGDPVVKAMRSTDGGITFGKSVVIDNVQNSGRVDVVLDPNGDAWISWLGSQNAKPTLALRRWQQSGTLGTTHYISGMDVSRRSGFPRMAAVDEGILMAWTDPADGNSIKTILLN